MIWLTGCSYDSNQDVQLVTIEGEEDTSTPMHMVALNTPKPTNGTIEAEIQSRISEVETSGGIAIISDPDIFGFTSANELINLKGYTAIELNPLGDYSLWDAILTARVKANEPLVWGILCDDFHSSTDLGKGFIMLQAPEFSEAEILESINLGRFYWGNSTLIKSISLTGTAIKITTTDDYAIKFISANGQLVQESSGKSSLYQITGDEGYIRIEVKNTNGQKAGTQPIRIRSTSEIENPYFSGGTWYKGNLHTHSTESDGVLSRQEIIDLYQVNDYAFLAFTDHVVWMVPVESEARISGTLNYTGELDPGTAWVLVKPLDNDRRILASAKLTLNGSDQYEYLVPYIPEGTGMVTALITGSGSFYLSSSDVLLAEGKYPSFIDITDKSLISGIDFRLVDVPN